MNYMIDVDGALADFTKSFYALAEQTGHTTLTVSDWGYPDIPRETQAATWGEIKKSLNFWLKLDSLLSEEDRVLLLAHAVDIRNPVYFVTSRPGVAALWQTKRWLKEHVGILCPNVVVVNGAEHKAQLARILGADFSLEDNRENALGIARTIGPARSVVIKRNYNVGYPYKNVESIQEFFEYTESLTT